MAIYLFVDKSKNEFSLAPAVARIDNLGNVAALHKVFEYGKLLLLAAGNGKLPILRDNGEIVILPFSVTPFCSCSSIPLFIGFTSAGLPLGVTFSFLISSPMVDLGSLVLLMSIFGWKIAVAYVVLGLVIAVAGGTLIEKLHLESYVEDFIRGGNSLDVPQEELHFKDRIKYAWEQVLATAKKVAPYVLIGVGIGAFIHDWIPEDFIVKVLGTGNPFGVILATIAGVPMYADIFGTIPIAEAIMLYYFEGMTDVEIGKLFNTSRSTIQYRRTSSFEILKKYLEEHADEWDEW